MNKRMYDDANDNFYYAAGLVVGQQYPDAPMEFRKKFVSNFKRFIERSGGQETFYNAQDAIRQFVFNQTKRGYKKYV